MKQDPGKVKHRKLSKPQGGEAANRWHGDTPSKSSSDHIPKLTRKPQPRGDLPAITRHPQSNTKTIPRLTPKPRTQMLSKHPQKPVKHHDYSKSGGQALDAFRKSPSHQEHVKLTKLAREIIKMHTAAPPSGLQGDTKSDAERLTSAAFTITNPFMNAVSDARVAKNEYLEEAARAAKKAENDKYSGSASKLAMGFLNMKGPIGAAVADAGNLSGKAVRGLKLDELPAFKAMAPAARAEVVGEVSENLGKELVNLPANAVPSLYYAGKPLAQGVASGNLDKAGAGATETGRRLIQPYVNFAKDPQGTLREHPLSSALMVLGPAKALDRGVGRIEQRAVPGMKPRKPYVPVEQKLPGTSAKNLILPRQGAIASRIQKKTKAAPRMSDAQIAKRTDETFYHSVHQSRQEAYKAIKDAKAKGIHDEAKLQEIGKNTLKVYHDIYRDETVKDLALRDKSGRLRTFKNPEPKRSTVGVEAGALNAIEKWGQGMINMGRDAVMTKYDHNGREIRGARGKDVQTLVPQVLRSGPNAGKYVLIPKIAADQLVQHDSYLAQTPLSAVGQAVGGTFRRTVLPFSPKWLNNNYTEAALRGGLNTIGPLSYREANKVFKNLSPAQVGEWNNLVKSTGHGGMQRQLLQEGTTFADRLEHTKYENVGRAITKFGQSPGPKTAAKVFDKYTDIVFSQLNGRMENAMHMGMAGKVLRRNPLMSQKVVELTQKAMKDPDGPKTVEARNNLIALGREVDRMFGKYGKFSPSIRRSVATWTPFIPWSLNAVHFITQHLPNDHPVVTALIADAHQTSQEWRNRHGLGYFIDGKLPPFLQGSIPGGQGSHWLIFTQGTPFSFATDPTGSAARGFNPLGQTILNNLSGLDWKGDKLKNDNPGVRMEQAILSLLEATTPIGYAANRLTSGESSTNENLMKWAQPYHPVKGKESKESKKGPFDQKPSSSTNDNPFDSGSKKKKSSNPFDG